MRPTYFRRLVQIGSFLRKEAIDVVHQPRLLLTLVIGPFAILAVFGIGYRDTPKPMRTLFVAPPGSPLLERVEQYAEEIKFYVEFAGTSNDAAAAERQLLKGDIDLIVSFPDDPLGTVLKGQQPPISVVHTRLDPIERTAITFASQIAVDRINGQILAGIIEGGKAYADPAVEVLADANATLAKLDAAVNTRDAAAVREAVAEVQAATADLSVAGRIDAELTEQLAASGGDAQQATAATTAFKNLQATVQALDADATAADVANARAAMEEIRVNYGKLSAVDPAVLVRPFTRQVRLAVANVNNVTDWYAPAAIVLMLQQFGVAFGALSFVRERQLGIVEVFRVAPVGATETLIGKYLAYLLIGGAIGTAL
ncbi:MAG TPA: ABC transporter permease, partial [Mycobacteriales bacterium]|nr:ABC transporter permease [Mycobacteriales bacterium]